MNTTVWLISYSMRGESMRVVHTHNAIADYRSLDPNATVKSFDVDAVEDLIAFLRDADCNCRPETEHYAAHTCSRCELLARVGGGE